MYNPCMGTDVEPYKGDGVSKVVGGIDTVTDSELAEVVADLDSEPYASKFDNLFDLVFERNEKESNEFVSDDRINNAQVDPGDLFHNDGWRIKCNPLKATAKNYGNKKVTIIEDINSTRERLTRIVVLGSVLMPGGVKRRTFELKQFKFNTERLLIDNPVHPDYGLASDRDRFWKDKAWILEVPYHEDLGTKLERFTEHVKTWEPAGNKKGFIGVSILH